jgi:predicted Zn-dependent peptidase
VAGNIKTAEVLPLVEKWFGSIPSGEKYLRNIPQEPAQQEARQKEISANVPLDAFYKTWHMPSRLERGYYVADLITDILGGGASSRLYQKLVKEKQLFSNLDCYHFGSTDAGLLTVEGKLIKGISFEAAEKAVNEEVEKIAAQNVEEKELSKVKNKTESTILFEDMSLMSRAASLAYYELLGNAELMNEELEKYQSVTAAELRTEAEKIFRPQLSNTLYYHAAP